MEMDPTEKLIEDADLAVGAISLGDVSASTSSTIALHWQVSPFSGNESRMIPLLMKDGNGESGRSSELPTARQEAIKRMADSVGMSIGQAYSLRRQLMKNLVFTFRVRNFDNLDMGSQEGQLEFAKLFEDATSSFLNKHGCLHLTDTQQLELTANPRLLNERELIERINTWVPHTIEMSKKGPVQHYIGQCCGCQDTSLRVARFLPSLERLKFCPSCRERPIQVSKSTDLIPGFNPDILFLQPVLINGRTVHWIECKAYYGSAMLSSEKKYRKLPVNKVQAQLDRYTKAYGPGAVLFLGGFHSKIKITGSLILDATPLDLTAIDAFRTS